MFGHLRKSLVHTFEARASEWALGWMLLLWGVVLDQHPGLFASNVAMTGLETMFRQESWSLACLIIGGGRLLILGLNGTVRRSPHFRALAAFLSCFFWTQISIGLLISGSGTTGLAVYPVLLALDAYNVIRAMREAGAIDKHFKRLAANHGTDT